MFLSYEKDGESVFDWIWKKPAMAFSKEPRLVSCWLPPGQREGQEETSFWPDVASLLIVSDTGVCRILWEGFKFFCYFCYFFYFF